MYVYMSTYFVMLDALRVAGMAASVFAKSLSGPEHGEINVKFKNITHCQTEFNTK